MKHLAEFTIIGNVGNVKTVGTTVYVSICSNYRKRDDKGKWVADPYWNDVTIFGKQSKAYAKKYLAPGDQVFARGRFRNGKYADKKTGEIIYTTNVICTEISRQSRPNKQGDTTDFDTEGDEF